MTTQQAATAESAAQLKPEERLNLSRSAIVGHMQKDNSILHILKPVVSSYAESNPIKTLGIAAVIGAAIVVLKPWRLITIGSLLAMLKLRS
jgi:ElaB/YqjD/DUF883 family membrane-anchored ribosome-binding protein